MKEINMESKPMYNERMERIEKLLYALKYEVSIGIINNEIDENIQFRFIVNMSRTPDKDIVSCKFITKPVKFLDNHGNEYEKP